ncbi:ABC transporter ATP-binding protein [Colwellia hornerae]|uniref:ABC transporter ATP-binding protein n=1 Tax=Colwellia hornerae TaxID=89402 RepID=A0A5C6Q5F6_9GAMM|nr:ABC transporter ATP-binding protein [Colwellia hornerae]TWX59470.1 ABC transporter ATP-binding protein [Colwellia hornerae]TWX62840.1 ABC transporter ATP-binding protein [Colwellia hornerae]TWX64059.1 ABC transporter ATP-binding protein [Colwellia hornerae]
MSLVLENLSYELNGSTRIHNVNLTLESGIFNVLLGKKGAVNAGKTTLMRLIAGLETPSSGRILLNGVDLVNTPVQKRNVSMVHHQFINYTHLTVRENIASPLRVLGLKKTEIDYRVNEIATSLHIETYLDRYPLELSGGQQQRTAMARALVKDADILLLDEPLINLDYKLREELRAEIRDLLVERNCIAIYATTNPKIAMVLGGKSILMHEGHVIQEGLAVDVYNQPSNIESAKLSSDPEINLIDGCIDDSQIIFAQFLRFPLSSLLDDLIPGNYRFGIRPSHLKMAPVDDSDLELSMRVDLAEISGSETILRISNNHFNLVMHLAGIHKYHTDTQIKIYIPIHKFFVFDMNGLLIKLPTLSY